MENIKKLTWENLKEFDPKIVDINNAMPSIRKFFEDKVEIVTDSLQDDIVNAIGQVTKRGIVTVDLGGKAGTKEITEAVLAAIGTQVEVF
mgnify:CR=1 FL=1